METFFKILSFFFQWNLKCFAIRIYKLSFAGMSNQIDTVSQMFCFGFFSISSTQSQPNPNFVDRVSFIWLYTGVNICIYERTYLIESSKPNQTKAYSIHISIVTICHASNKLWIYYLYADINCVGSIEKTPKEKDGVSRQFQSEIESRKAKVRQNII